MPGIFIAGLTIGIVTWANSPQMVRAVVSGAIVTPLSQANEAARLL
jgi:hypothetical protein